MCQPLCMALVPRQTRPANPCPHGLSSLIGIRQQRNNIVPDDNKCYRESKQELGCPCMDCHGIFPNLLLVQLFGVQMEALIQV